MFIEYNQDQTFLLPPNYKEFLWDSHEAVILNELVDELDLRKLLDQYVDEWQWRPAYHPRMILKVLFYWYMNQTFSSRKLAIKLQSDLWFMYIAGNNKPDFRTINRFRKEKWEILEDIFTQIVLKAKELWMISFWTVSLDGTKIYANASINKSHTIEKLDKKIEKLFQEAEEIDAIEDGIYWDWDWSNLPDELRTKEWRDEKKKEIQKQKERLEKKKEIIQTELERKKEQWIKQDRINLTDTDARLMKMKRKDWWVWYNPQNITENQFILTTTVSNSAEDTWELQPILEKFFERYDTYPEKNLADWWYASEENYQYLEERNIQSYIPHQKPQLDLKEYIYNQAEDSYTDKEWNTYVFKQHVWKKKMWKQSTRWRPRKWSELKEEDIKATKYITTLKCWKQKIITINRNRLALCERNDERLYSDKGQEIYKKRSGCVENVFGNLKMNLWFERFRLRWFEWVQTERNLISLAHNIKKLIQFQVA